MHTVHFIKEQIRKQNYRLGELLPGQRILAEQLKVSRPTVKRAIQYMEREGVVSCSPSIGTVVMKVPQEKMLIGYVVKDLQDPFHLELIRELDTLLHACDGGLVVFQDPSVKRLQQLGVTHLVKHHELFSPDEDSGFPAIYIGNVAADVSSVCSDVGYGMEQILDHLTGLGHTSLAYASLFTSEEDVQFSFLRKHMSTRGISIDEDMIFQIEPTDIPGCASVLERIRDHSPRPGALICYNDWLAATVLKASEMVKIDIPGELSLTGYDDLYMSNILRVPLTTVRFSRRETAKKIMEMLMHPHAGERRNSVIETRLVVRDSTQPIRRRV